MSITDPVLLFSLLGVGFMLCMAVYLIWFFIKKSGGR